MSRTGPRRPLVGRVFASIITTLTLATATVLPASAATADPAGSPGSQASATSSAAGSIADVLTRSFAAGRHVGGDAIGGVRAGTLHTGTADGKTWAIAAFDAADSARPEQAIALQDANTGVFVQSGSSWKLVSAGLYGCAGGLPAALKTAWGISAPSVCSGSAPAEQAAARKAMTATPADGTTPLGQKIADIALSQVGVQTNPPVPNFNTIDCDPYSTLVAGFSSNSDGCGFDSTFNVRNQNETWCADFAKWVWQQAGVTADMNTLNAGAVSFHTWAVHQGQNPQANTGTPEPGDAVLFYRPGRLPNGFADHVGLVSGINPDGTINMVNGDFSGDAAVDVQYDQNIKDLAAFAASVESPGEQWALVTPPTTAQQPNPAGQMDAATVAVDGAAARFHASGSVPGGTITGYYWTFGDTRMTNETGADVTHVFSEPGTYTATVTITSSFGTTTTVRKNIQVIAASSAVASAPVDQIWYDPLPVVQYTFTRSAGGLAVDYWNGGQWIQWAVPGSPDAKGTITALTYPDTANADVNTAHAFYRTANGSLAETLQTQTSQTSAGWQTQSLPGTAVAGGAINATTTQDGYAEVFFVNDHRQLSADVQSASGWSTRVLDPAPVADPGSLVLADTTTGPVILGIGPAGLLTSTTDVGPAWITVPLPAFAAKGSSLAAATTAAGTAEVFYTTPTGTLGEATQDGFRWKPSTLPGSPTAAGGKAATTYLLPSVLPANVGDFPQPPGTLTETSVSAPLGMEVFYLTASGAPAVTYNDGSGWQTKALPGTADGIVGASAYQVDEEPSNLYLSSGQTVSEETTGARSGDPSGDWHAAPALPTAPSTWANQIILYAADSADAATAQAAASAAGLPAQQVTTSFATAWADSLDGNYLVYAVGTPAVRALYSNVCNWANPSDLPGPGTPFSYGVDPVNTLAQVGPGNFINAAGATAADTQAIATDLAYYALHGVLPPGVTSVPPQVGAPYACMGSPN